MKDMKKFSVYYAKNEEMHTDTPEFRDRMLKYLEDVFNSGYPLEFYTACRKELGIDIDFRPGQHAKILINKYYFEEALKNVDIKKILTSITVIYNVMANHRDTWGNQKLDDFVNGCNSILQEESMCYIVYEDGKVRYYPDEEAHKQIKCTLLILSKEEYKKYLNMFNDVLDELYKNHNHESPVSQLFYLIEAFILSNTTGNSGNVLNKSSIDNFMDKAKQNADKIYSTEEINILEKTRDIFINWVGGANKYRHGKKDQENKVVPEELFIYLFSTGVSILRFILDIHFKFLNK
jgi:hypothetical protein